MYVCMYVCMCVCMYVSNAIGIQSLQLCFLSTMESYFSGKEVWTAISKASDGLNNQLSS